MVSWGADNGGQVSGTPTGTGFIAVVSGQFNCVALKADGSLVSWGDDNFGLVSDTPTGTGFIAIAAGTHHKVAIRVANEAPVVYAGTDQSIVFGTVASLNATVTDDGAPTPPASVTTTWSKVSGPGTVTFAHPDAIDTTATFTKPGEYVLQLAAFDGALSATDQVTVTVNPWTLSGFKNPVRMGEGVWNNVKAGRTVPLKFEVFAGNVEITTVAAVTSVTATQAPCPGDTESTPQTEPASTVTTRLRYDAQAGQFIQNWKTPRTPGACYSITLTTADRSTLRATFKLS